MNADSKDPEPQDPIGGWLFSSLIFLTVLAVFLLVRLPALVASAEVGRLSAFLSGALLGFTVTLIALPLRLHVFIHELKHSIISNLAGNKAKGMKVEHGSGEFSFEYTKRTAAYNAFIALAPYWFPLLTLIVPTAGLVFLPSESRIFLALVGVCAGADLRMNTKDISPWQTDFSDLRGGFRVGLWYVIVINITLLGILVAWIVQGTTGITSLWWELWETSKKLVFGWKGISA